jgi:nitrogen regulatory protein PII
MKAVVVVTDWEVMQQVESALLDAGTEGFTIIPRVLGSGRSGVKTGDRIHPGGSSLMFSVVPNDHLDDTLRVVREVRDRTQSARDTRIFVIDADLID